MSKGNEGWDCDPANPDGSRTCRRIDADKKTGKRVSTGTDITVSADPESCDAIFSGGKQVMLDKDDRAIKTIADKVTSDCRRRKGL